MKKLRRIQFFAPILALAMVQDAAGRENAYDVVGKLLRPFIGTVSERKGDANRALKLEARVEALTGLPPAVGDARARLFLEAPDKLRLDVPLQDEEITVCRRGQEIWVYPGSKLQTLLDAAEADGRKLPAMKKKARLEPLRLPIPEKQLVFLPALLVVRDAGDEEVAGEACRVLDLQLMAEIAKSLGPNADWAARVWVRADYRPAQLLVRRKHWSATIRFETVEFSKTLPKTTWQPTPEEAADVKSLSPMEFDQILRALTGEQ